MTMRSTRRQFSASALAAMTLVTLPKRLMASSQSFAGGKLHSFSDGPMNLPIESVFYVLLVRSAIGCLSSSKSKIVFAFKDKLIYKVESNPITRKRLFLAT